MTLTTNLLPLQSPPTLLTLTSKVVSSTYPFALIEDRYKNIIPEPVQKSIIYHSFPKRESDVLVYASSDFSPDKYSIDNVVQIGFHVSGIVYELIPVSKRSGRSGSSSRRNSNEEDGDVLSLSTPHHQGPSFKVSATFDRGKITSVTCTCENENLIFWCDHVIALALHRIRKCVQGVDFVLRVPISETLLQLNRPQLQKLVQYLISDHTDVLPTAQRLADEILFMKTDDNYINRIHGAPDITAGPSPTDPHTWALNTLTIQSQVRTYITSPQPTHQNIITTLIDKSYRMIKSNDSNATRIVQIITNELVRHTTRQPPRFTLPPQIWDQITRIWNVLVLKPNITEPESSVLKSTLTILSSNDNLPPNEEHTDTEEEDPTTPKRQKTSSSIFKYTLKLLNKSVNPHDYDCSSLHSLVCHGTEDTPFALKILTSLKSTHHPRLRIENAHVLYDVLHRPHPESAYEAALIALTCRTTLKPTPHVHEKHMKLVEKLISKIHSMGTTHIRILQKYSSNLLNDPPPNSSFPPISFVTYAFNTLNSTTGYKLALKHLELTDYPYVHSHVEAQQIALATTLLTTSKNDEQALEEISTTIIRVVKSNTNVFRLAQEVFKHASNEKLINVSFNIALHVVKATKYTNHRRRWEMVRWIVSCGVEIGVAKLFYLVRNWGEYFSAVEAVGTVASNIIAWVGGGVGNGGSSAVVCSSGSCGVSNASSSGSQGQGASASVNPSVKMISSSGSVDKRVLEELSNAARNLAIQCAKNDPQNCALNTLTLCETDPIAFETSYQIVLESASKEFLTPQQIFTIARYMEHRGYTQRAYRLAVIAVQFVHIGYNQDTHSLISEIHWTCNLSHQLSTPLPPPPPPQPTSTSTRSRYSIPQPQQPPRYYRHHTQPHTSQPLLPLTPPTSEIDNLIPLLIRNIKCATVLTEILRRSITIITSYENAYQKTQSHSKKLKHRVYEKLSLLIEGTIDAFITTIHSRLVHISPRHYSDFIEFLTKARENFLLAPNGTDRFNRLIESMKLMKSLRGKKKLLFLLNERFR